MRILCLFFPRLGVQMAVRQRPALAGRKVALIDGCGAGSTVTGASPEATGAGVLLGMDGSQARRRCPDAVYLPDTPGLCLDQLERMAAIIRTRATTAVEVAGRQHLFVDMGGLELLGQDEERCGARLRALAESWTGLEVRAGVADTRREALEAARAAKGARPVVCRALGDTETRPVHDRSHESVRSLVRVAPGALPRQQLLRLVARLATVLEARGEGYREMVLGVETPSGWRTFSMKVDAPLVGCEGMLGLISNRVPGEVLDDAVAFEVELRRLAPDVRQPRWATIEPARLAPGVPPGQPAHSGWHTMARTA